MMMTGNGDDNDNDNICFPSLRFSSPKEVRWEN